MKEVNEAIFSLKADKALVPGSSLLPFYPYISLEYNGLDEDYILCQWNGQQWG